MTAPFITEFPAIYERVATLLPKKPWRKTVNDIELLSRQIAGRGGQEQVENPIAFGLTFWERHHYDQPVGYEWNTMLEAMLFSKRVLDLWDVVEQGGLGPPDLKKRFTGGFKFAADMRALQFELYMAATLSSRGCIIEWPEESKGIETFDLLVYLPGGTTPFELECKSFAGDKGFAVRMADGHRVIGAVLERVSLSDTLSSEDGRVSILTISISNPVPKSATEFKALIDRLVCAIQSRKAYDDNNGIRIQYDYCEVVGDPDHQDACINTAYRLPGPMVAFVRCSDIEDRLMGIRVISEADIKLWDEVEKVARKAMDVQLTGTRPGALALQFINDTVEPFDNVLGTSSQYHRLSEKLFKREHGVALILASSIELYPEMPEPPYRADAFQTEACKVAALYNPSHDFPIAKLKALLDPY
ncbi:hypothetical protein [Pseudomonas sp. TWRC1-2]|uniref:hypothetical protein n=1 Tax=Pseudomonas sp. TWRC1-2 TaxID=2804628 RepID=UPI003CF506F3